MKAGNFKFIIRALRYRNYRLFFMGQSISLTGSWMQMVAMGWLVYRLTNSAFLLGLVAFTSQIPMLILTPFAGVFADRYNRRKLLIITQILSLIQAFSLAVLSLTGVIAVWHIIVLSVFAGLVNAFDVPTRQAFIVDMVEKKEDLSNAIALNSFIFNGARLVGASIAGILIATLGEGLCFLLNSLSFIPVVIALYMMKIKKKNLQPGNKNMLHDLKDGFVYVFGNPHIKYVLLLVSLVSLMGMSYMIVMPIFAKDILLGDAHTLGFLMGAIGLGAVAGALFLASRENTLGLEKVISFATLIFGAGLIAFSFSRILWLSMILLLFAGFGMMIQMVSSNTLLQSITGDDKRGRVMSFHALAFLGIAPLGSLLAGSLAASIGAPNTLAISGLFCIAGSFLFRKLWANSSAVPHNS